jgi:predicted unusual protein kinase regulating ubiquinone biosynthesis (AarF/ABC1/UbiB family)
MNETHATEAAPAESQGRLARNAQILRFLLRYRNAGIFNGLDEAASFADVDAAGGDVADDATPADFVRDLEALGPTFVKLGQMLSTRPDIVPPAFAQALERMQEDVSPVEFEAVRACVEGELGVRLGKMFVQFDETPLGSASLAQVHRATLRDGTEVAVKVQRPHIVQQLMGDLNLLRSMASTADRMTDLGRRVHFGDWLHEFRQAVVAELDYVAEAENLERFGEHLAPYPQLWVPQPVWDLTRRRVLTMQLARGVRVDQISGLARTEHDMRPLASALMQGYLDQVFVHGEIHADPHPGNLRVTPDGRLAIFDLGMVAHVPPRQRDRLLRLLFAAVDGRGEQVAEEAIAMGTRLEDFDEERYLREVGRLISRYAAHASSASEGRMVLELVRIAMACGLRTPPEMSLLGKTLLNLDSVCRALTPELDMKGVVEEHLQDVMRARLRKSLSSPNLASEAMELQTLVRDAPRKISDTLSLLAENRMQVRLVGLEDSQLMENLQKIANRVSAGIVAAALILAAALMMRVQTASTLFGYPTLAVLLMMLGAGVGLAIVYHSLRRDRKARMREERAPR